MYKLIYSILIYTYSHFRIVDQYFHRKQIYHRVQCIYKVPFVFNLVDSVLFQISLGQYHYAPSGRLYTFAIDLGRSFLLHSGFCSRVLILQNIFVLICILIGLIFLLQSLIYLDKCIQNYHVVQNIFTALKYPIYFISSTSPSFPKLLATIHLFTISIILSFLEYHMTGMYCMWAVQIDRLVCFIQQYACKVNLYLGKV